ncbi:MAG: hypothetical protein JOZ46_12650 [Candidatus Dormibacteraeota bacterium]|nr:hypothetical protein [Candidatus Dormibacteraeota bacterium]MBV9526651.1 hypothetical protein [Candidatus Dormibacteraeota bacterium]
MHARLAMLPLLAAASLAATVGGTHPLHAAAETRDERAAAHHEHHRPGHIRAERERSRRAQASRAAVHAQRAGPANLTAQPRSTAGTGVATRVEPPSPPRVRVTALAASLAASHRAQRPHAGAPAATARPSPPAQTQLPPPVVAAGPGLASPASLLRPIAGSGLAAWLTLAASLALALCAAAAGLTLMRSRGGR